jgi:formylglycine-generating enzyme required for sulfatase activity
MKAGGAAQKLRQPGIGVTWTCQHLEIEFCGIPAGEFKMGTDLANFKDKDAKTLESMGEKRHDVRIAKGFYLAKTPVTQRQFMELTGFNPSYFRGDKRPVEQVSWPEAQAFCTWLTILERGKGRLPPGWIYRLPTEAEWEYACRAGDDEVFDYEDIDERAWYKDNSNNETHIVKKKMANSWGLHDMLGNVNEWTVDWHSDQVPTELAVDPVGPRSGSARVVRGGGFADPGGSCRPALRAGIAPSFRDIALGFRLALSFVGVPDKPGKEKR